MDRVSSPHWQSAWLRQHGPSYTDANDVLQSYQQVIEALGIVGREDVAAALSSRVTKEVCAKHAPVLAVIMAMSRRPSRVNVPENVAVSNQSPLQVWESLLAEEPLYGEHWRDATFDFSESDTESLELASDLSTDKSNDSEVSICERNVEIVQVPAKDPPVFCDVLTERAAIREITYMLLGHNTRSVEAFEGATLSRAALTGIMQEARSFTLVLGRLRLLSRHPLLGPALTEVVDDCHQKLLGVRSCTLLSACDEFQAILSPLCPLITLSDDYFTALATLRENYPRIYKSAIKPLLVAIEQWLGGFVSFIVEVSDVPASQWWSQKFRLIELPPFISVPQLEDGGKCAWISRQLGLTVAVPELDAEKPLQWQLFDAALRNSAQLMDHVRPELLKHWTALSDVYLAQSPQTLDIIYEASIKGVRLGSKATLAARNRLQAILVTRWPSAPVFDGNLVPCIDIPPYMHNVFSMSRLVDFWARIVDVVYEKSQDAVLVELEAASFTREIRDRILNADGLGRIF